LPNQGLELCRRCYRRQYYLDHIEEHKDYGRAYRETHRAEKAASDQRLYPQRREYCIKKAREYDARKLAATVGDPPDEAAILELYGHTCVYCGQPGVKGVDHVVPLILGGLHIEENIVASCARCNRSKGVLPLEAWLAGQPQRRAWVA